MSSRVVLVVVLVLAAVALGLLFWVQCRPGTTISGPRTTVGGAWYEIGFTQPRYPDRPEYHRGGLDERLVALIDQTRRTLDVAIYDFDLSNVATAMARAKARGVTVRMVTDTDTVEAKNNAPVQQALAAVREAGIPIVDDQRGAIMHHKFVVSDGEVVLTGSWNFTDGDTYRLNNNAVRFTSRELAANFSAEFEKMFAQHAFGPTKPKGVPHPLVQIGDARVETHFGSEEDPSVRLIQLIKGARRRIDFLAFSFTHEGIGEAVMERGGAGVAVRGVFETTGSETRFSEFGKLKERGFEVYQDGNPYVMHHKVFVIDERVTVFGSFNFSANAAESNDENMVVVDDPRFARTFLEEVERIVTQAKNPVRGSR
ncbi:MAG TPA: phospholipase D-like domain-containing protein [Chloroflexota bacterium]|nr:phospholipase D-like domain-containing protein [Chloroflexota bacterium]